MTLEKYAEKTDLKKIIGDKGWSQQGQKPPAIRHSKQRRLGPALRLQAGDGGRGKKLGGFYGAVN